MKKFLLAVTLVCALLPAAYCQNVGIGTSTPKARLHVTDSSVLFSASGPAPLLTYNPPVSGAGRRTMWYADKAAFRTGFVSGNAWDRDSIGYYSFAAGYDAKATDVGAVAFSHYAQARGIYSFAMGYNTKALNPYSFSMGLSTIAAGDAAIAMGNGAVATGIHAISIGSGKSTGAGSISLGSGTEASDIVAVAIGNGSKATNTHATAIGGGKASGTQAVAIGPVTASGNLSIAIGGGGSSTNDKIGACVISDSYTSTTLYSSANYQLSMRFVGGYKFYSSSDLSTGVQLAFGGGSWTALCDRRLKDNFLPVNNEELLEKVAALPITNWNYKMQPKTQRHIGPMAQDFYAAFHLDGEGADTTINTMDISGVSMAAIQALEKRTKNLKQENEKLKELNEKSEAELKDVKARLQRLEILLKK